MTDEYQDTNDVQVIFFRSSKQREPLYGGRDKNKYQLSSAMPDIFIRYKINFRAMTAKRTHTRHPLC